ncbi:DUF5977 domain-containing protein [Chryseobacterium cucumeris]|uniref:DUF5977 domain-containing protein n=1 Tax=Chryseobacterium cucumeris TaxID=1813611 RepID=UPI00192DB7CD|nr:DUF5977 domain-containing protein [Chryseobacterium cucumeris]QRA43352.1 hypothetical protein JNG87_00935 [Chryseobacterium cucumeris]
MKKNIILSFVLGAFFTVHAQNNQNKYSEYYFKNFPNSPSTATFLRYGDIQNSEYTGTNSPQIPLLTAESGAIKIPLVLRYISGNGIKVAQEAGSVGLGWDINLPTITQSILGGYSDFDDVAKYLAPFTQSANPFNNYFPHSVQPLPAGFVSQPTKDAYSYYKTIDGFLPLNGNFADLHNSAPFTVDTDTSPDIFTCNLFGEKLEFVINNYPTGITNHTFNPIFYCLNKKGYKISYSDSTYFTIIDPTGIKYYFAKVEVVKTLNSVSKNYVITKITDINNNDINFTYNEYSNVRNLPFVGQKLNYTYGNQTYHYSSLPLDNTQNFSWIGEFDEQYPGSSMNPLSSSQTVGFMAPPIINWSTEQNYLLINNISGNFGKVNFYYSDRLDFPTQKLDRIEEQNNINQVVKTINLNYDYFNSQNSITLTQPNQIYTQDRLTKRLKLLSVKINSDLYTFGYNETLLPSKSSTGVDYWGYSNGGFNNKTLFLNPNDFSYPTPVPVDNNYNNNFKQANINFTQSAILTKVFYPTKGSSSFEYELNSASNLFNQYDYGKLTVGNGLRLASQTNRDINNQFIGKTEFKYFDGITTNPLFLFNKNTYSTLQINNSSQSADSQSSGIISMSCNNNNSSSPISSGDYIGYSKVIKTEKDAQNNNNGSIETNYSNTSDSHYYLQNGVIPISMPSTKSTNSTENGKVLSEIIYDSSMNKVQQTDNIYSEIYSNVYYGTSLSRNSRSVWNVISFNGAFESHQHGVTVLGYYPIFSKESLLSKSIKKDYLNNKIFTTESNYLYSGLNNLNNKTTTFPDGGTESIQISYATPADNQRLFNANIVSVPISKVISKGGEDYSQFTTKYDNASHLNPTSVVETSQVQPPNYTVENKTVIKYTNYDNKGNLLEYTNTAGVPTTIVWGYHQTLPIAKIEGAFYGSISQFLQGIIDKSDADIDATSEQDLLNAIDGLRKRPEMNGYQITSYTYNPLVGVTNIIPPSGIREQYLYDSSNRLKQIIDVNGKILKENEYNYVPTTFYNSLQSKPFTRNNCGSGAIGGVYNYIVPAGQYTSIIDQSDADQKALNDINTNGQNAANSNGICTPIYCSLSFNSSLGISGGGSVSVSQNSSYKLSFGFSSGSNSANLPWATTGVKIATITGTCKPTTDFLSYNGQIYCTIQTNGDVILKTHSGNALPNNTSYNYEFYFPIN